MILIAYLALCVFVFTLITFLLSCLVSSRCPECKKKVFFWQSKGPNFEPMHLECQMPSILKLLEDPGTRAAYYREKLEAAKHGIKIP